MQLNSAIWGDDSNKTPIYTNTNFFYSSKIGASSLGEYRTEYGMVDLIDESVNYWQIADFSMFNSVVYCRRDGNNAPVKTMCRSTMPRSIFLVSSAPTASNMTFNPAQGQNIIWSDTISGTSAYSGTNYKIGAWFNYNDIVAIFRLVCQKIVDNVPTGNNVTLSIYDYYHSSDGNNLPYAENYVIKSIGVGFAVRSTVSDIIQSQNNLQFVSSTPVNTPQPNYYWNKSSYISYTQHHATGIYDMGSNSNSGAGGYGTQQGAYGQSNNALLFGYDPDSWEIRSYQSGTSTYEYFVCSCTYDEMLRHAASLGFWFNETWASQTSMQFDTGENCTDDHVILPEIVNGRTTGNYKRGRQAGADPQALWGNQWRDSVGYTGDKPYKHDTNDRGDLTTVFHRASLANSLNYYVFNDLMLKDLITNINTGYQPQNQEQFTVDFKGSNPADYVANVIFYPDGFVCPSTTQSFTSVKIGAVTFTFPTGVNAADVEAGYFKEYEPVTISPEYNSFMDYAPYTSISLYVPFCGSIDLDPAIWMNHTLTVRLFIDYLTGSCTAVLLRDNLAVDSINGTCGITIPITAIATGSYQNSIKSAEIAIKQAEIQRKSAWLSAAGAAGAIIGGAASGNPVAVLGGIAGAVGAANAIESAELKSELAEYNIDHIAPAVENVSAASPANAIGMDYDIHLLIKRPIYMNGYDENAYSQTIGHACCISGQLSQFSGLTIANAIKLENISTENGLAATAAELQMIRKCAENGIYL